jgi:sulfite oxidase
MWIHPRNAIPYLTTRNLHPENQESPIHHLNAWITPADYVYRRNHFAFPIPNEDLLHLHVDGQVHQPLRLHYKDLIAMPAHTVVVPLECSGNKRAFFEPRVFGESWEGDAISQTVWKGVPLRELLQTAQIQSTARGGRVYWR